MSKLLSLLFIVTMSLNASAKALESHYSLAWDLNETTWCFEDKEGPWDHGRIKFHTDFWGRNTAFYDVTDAPGPGGIQMKWATYYTFGLGWTMVLSSGHATSYKRYMVHVDPGHDQMVWTFRDNEHRVSKLNRCQ